MRGLALGLVLGLALCWAGPGRAGDDPKDVVGTWQGTLKPGLGSELRLVLRIERGGDGVLSATLESPDQSPGARKLDQVALDGTRLTLVAEPINARFEGELNADAAEIRGRWKQAADLPIVFKKIDPSEAARAPEAPGSLAGLWSGALEGLPGGIQLRVVLRVEKGEDGRFVAFLDSPDQEVKGLPASEISLEGDTLKFAVKAVGARFEGKFDEASNAYKGKFKQGLATLGLTLAKTDKVAEARHPQTPVPPFPYRSEDVRYVNAEAGNTLAGTLTLPEGDGPFPAALLITGSGPQDRDETLLGHKPFAVLADSLTRRGVAVLRVDDRGVGGSTGDPEEATSADFAGDVRAGVGFLKQHPRIDPKRIGLIGHSEGGLIAPMVAADSDDVAFIVLMAGPGITGEEILRLQSRLIAQAMGAKEESLTLQAEILDEVFAILREEPDDASALERIKARVAERLKSLPEDQLKALAEDEGGIEANLARIVGPWFRYFLRYDPRPTLARVRCPVLAINGEKDLQVPPRENLDAIAAALKSGGNDRGTLKEMPGLNHLFQTAKTGAPSEYSSIEETIAPAVLELLGDWIEGVVGGDDHGSERSDE
jgi:pimeloyl-ACP methyl ester carboxylesterase